MWDQLNNYKKAFRSDVTQYEYHQSLITHFGEMLIYAQELYGPRDPTFTILGIHISATHQNIYPVENWKHRQIIIQLCENWLTDWNNMLFWTAHEAFHCLRPTRKFPPNRLEEGFATHFASQYMNDKMGVPPAPTGVAKYDDAWRDVQAFIAAGGDLKGIALTTPTPFAELTAADLVKSMGGNQVLANALELDF
jgi:hypothetical protein